MYWIIYYWTDDSFNYQIIKKTSRTCNSLFCHFVRVYHLAIYVMLSTNFPQWTKYCRYGLKHKIINQLTSSSISIIDIFSLCHISPQKTSWSWGGTAREGGALFESLAVIYKKVTQNRLYWCSCGLFYFSHC